MASWWRPGSLLPTSFLPLLDLLLRVKRFATSLSPRGTYRRLLRIHLKAWICWLFVVSATIDSRQSDCRLLPRNFTHVSRIHYVKLGWDGACTTVRSKRVNPFGTHVHRPKKRRVRFYQASTVGRACASASAIMLNTCRTPPCIEVRAHPLPHPSGLLRVAGGVIAMLCLL